MERQEAPSPTPDPGVLADPVRRRLYEYIAGHHDAVRRDEAAEVLGITRALAAYHLERLVAAGFLATSYARPSGVGGPGAGRPAKHYRPVHEEVSVTVPPRSYALLARMLAQAAEADESGRVRTALTRAAQQEGRHGDDEDPDLLSALTHRGYQPAVTQAGDVQLGNCPFHQAARRHTDLVCGLNHALLRGYLAGRGDDPARAELAPRPGYCCVVIHPAPAGN